MVRKKQRRNPIPAVIVTVLIVSLISSACWFGYGYFIRNTHPIKYENYVERYARDNKVDKYLVYAVIKTESSYRPDAVSNVGARGLMQITEPTFDWIKYKMGDEDTVYYDMFDPKTNIKYGCFLLGYLYDEFGTIDTAMAAYHAGRGQVNEWLADSSISSDGVNLDVIPIPATAHYVDKIAKAMDTYIELYDE